MMKKIYNVKKGLASLVCFGISLGLMVLAPAAGNEASQHKRVRFYMYAPPVIPHDADLGTCLDCHNTSEMGAPMMPHKEITNCRQCHVPKKDVLLFKKNAFNGIPEPKKLKRAYKGAPPAMPHRLFMRENCLACHGPDSSEDVINTSHPERKNCRQCHVEQKEKGALFRKNTNVLDSLGK